MLACAWGGGCSRLRQDAGQSRCPHAPERCGDAAHGLVVAVPVPACARWRIGGRDGRQLSGRCPHAPGVVGCEHLTSTRVNPGVAWAGMVGVAHSRAPRTGGNRGIMRNSKVSSDHGPVPMCVDPSLHMGARPPHVTLTGKAYNYNKNQPLPRRGPGLLCAVSRTTAPTRHIRPPHNQPTTNSNRNSTDLEPECNRSRGGTGPISARNTTDLEKQNK